MIHIFLLISLYILFHSEIHHMWRSFHIDIIQLCTCRILNEMTHNLDLRSRSVSYPNHFFFFHVFCFTINLMLANIRDCSGFKYAIGVFRCENSWKDTQTQTGISFSELYGMSHLSEIYSVSIQCLKQKPLPPPPHMRRLNANMQQTECIIWAEEGK